MNKNIKQYIICVAIGLAVAALLLCLYLIRGTSGGSAAVITIDGTEVVRLPLDEATVYEIDNSYGKNTLVVEGGEIYVRSADCENQVCVNTGRISRVGEVIVCLPHRLVISIEE